MFFLIFIGLSSIAFADILVKQKHGGSITFVPTPDLRAPIPVHEKVDLKRKEALPFEWSMEGDPIRRDYYDFRIYKGYEMLASTLIFQQKTQVPRVLVPSSLFEADQVYTWAVRQVYKQGQKSRRNFDSFTAIR